MFIVIDWIDASGKKTQVDKISTHLRKNWKTVKVIDFPRYDYESSYFVREYLDGKYGKNLSPEMSSLFFAMDRFDASYDYQKDINKYDYVIANRYVSSSMIHHGCKIHDIKQRKVFLDWLENLEYKICKIPKPDKIFFLSFSFKNNQKLLQKRAYEKWTLELDLHESDTEYMLSAWEVAHKISEEYNWEKIVCDTGNTILEREEITEQILKKII